MILLPVFNEEIKGPRSVWVLTAIPSASQTDIQAFRFRASTLAQWEVLMSIKPITCHDPENVI